MWRSSDAFAKKNIFKKHLENDTSYHFQDLPVLWDFWPNWNCSSESQGAQVPRQFGFLLQNFLPIQLFHKHKHKAGDRPKVGGFNSTIHSLQVISHCCFQRSQILFMCQDKEEIRQTEMTQKLVCKFFNKGYCKFTSKFEHPENKCTEESCRNKICRKRHPKQCRYKEKCRRQTSCL